MKQILIFIFFVLIMNKLYSQDVVISVNHQNKLVYGMYNSLQIIVKEISNENIYLTTDNGKILKENNTFMIIPNRLGKTWINVFKIINQDTLLIEKQYFKTIDFTEYIVINLSGKIDGDSITKQELKANKRLSNYVKELDIDLHIVIEEFKIIILREDKLVYYKIFLSNEFDEQLKTIFETLKKEDIIYFVDIIGRGPSGKTLKLKTLKLTIK